MARSNSFLILLLAAMCAVTFPCFAQDRPLHTVDTATVPAGTLRSEVGFDFLQDVGFPLSGLRGDETSVGVVDLRMGVGFQFVVLRLFLRERFTSCHFVSLYAALVNPKRWSVP